jgi:hypothetical protein
MVSVKRIEAGKITEFDLELPCSDEQWMHIRAGALVALRKLATSGVDFGQDIVGFFFLFFHFCFSLVIFGLFMFF